MSKQGKKALVLIPLVLVNGAAVIVVRYKQLDRKNNLSAIRRKISKYYYREEHHIFETRQASNKILFEIKPYFDKEDFETLTQGIANIQEGKVDV